MIIALLKKNEITPKLQTQLTNLYKQLNADLKQLDLSTILENGDQTDVVIGMDGEVLVGIAMMAKYKVISGHKGMIVSKRKFFNFRIDVPGTDTAENPK